jgi:histone H1/5
MKKATKPSAATKLALKRPATKTLAAKPKTLAAKPKVMAKPSAKPKATAKSSPKPKPREAQDQAELVQVVARLAQSAEKLAQAAERLAEAAMWPSGARESAQEPEAQDEMLDRAEEVVEVVVVDEGEEE